MGGFFTAFRSKNASSFGIFDQCAWPNSYQKSALRSWLDSLRFTYAVPLYPNLVGLKRLKAWEKGPPVPRLACKILHGDFHPVGDAILLPLSI